MVTCLLDFLSSNHDKVAVTKLGPTTVNSVTFHWHSVGHSFFKKERITQEYRFDSIPLKILNKTNNLGNASTI